VAPAVGDITATLTDGVDSLVVPPADADAVVDAVATLEAHRAFGRRVASAARRTVERTASWEARAHQLLEALRERAAWPARVGVE
jgi:glycosyltransferase involved in cell wall biosynthesis